MIKVSEDANSVFNLKFVRIIGLHQITKQKSWKVRYLSIS